MPENLIAQSPLEKRENCRLLTINKTKKEFKDEHFYDILKYFKKGDVLVRNNTKVIPARLYGIKKETGAHVEVLLLKDLGDDKWECLVGNSKTIKTGSKISFGNDLLIGECIERKQEGIRIIKFYYDGIYLEILDKIGLMPLPPYIKKQVEDNNEYQKFYLN